jgi:hypothetical protein
MLLALVPRGRFIGSFTAVAISERSTRDPVRDIGNTDDKANGTPFLRLFFNG